MYGQYATSFPGFSPKVGRREPWERGWAGMEYNDSPQANFTSKRGLP